MKPHIKIDRPHIGSDDIARTKDFSALLKSYVALKNPLYKIWWLGGISTMLVFGTIAGLSNRPEDQSTRTAYVQRNESQLLAENTKVAQTNPEIHAEQGNEEVLILDDASSSETQTENLEQSTPPANDGATEAIPASNNEVDNAATDTARQVSDRKIYESTYELGAPEANKDPIPKTSFTPMDYNPHVAGIYDGNINQSVLLSNGIETVYPFEILSFKMGCPAIDEDKEYMAEGNQFTPEMRKAIKSLPYKSIVYFYDIMARDENGKEARLRSLRLFVIK